MRLRLGDRQTDKKAKTSNTLTSYTLTQRLSLTTSLTPAQSLSWGQRLHLLKIIEGLVGLASRT